MSLAYIGLGANLGEPLAALREATRRIAALPGCRLVAASRLYRSAPVDSSGPDYWNAVLLLDTELTAPALLTELQAIERAHGRERPYRNAPRTLDLDLLAHGELRVSSAELELPHPRLHERAFVLLPLLELSDSLPVLGALAPYLAAITDQRCEPSSEPLLA
jgi:2-amino-4-hydroxy-6-hydroxymethyldihydropteridine diphosphokinase